MNRCIVHGMVTGIVFGSTIWAFYELFNAMGLGY